MHTRDVGHVCLRRLGAVNTQQHRSAESKREFTDYELAKQHTDHHFSGPIGKSVSDDPVGNDSVSYAGSVGEPVGNQSVVAVDSGPEQRFTDHHQPDHNHDYDLEERA